MRSIRNGCPVTNDNASDVRRICPPPSPSEPSILIIASVLGPLAAWSHLHELRHELAEHGDQIALRFHHVAYVLVGHWNFVEAGADERHALLFEKAVYVFPIELLVRSLAT